ncbi:MAG: hypothetical protein E7672_02160 [Ruminococcaceae bacterium]|nr:hypothetical protein [Oscillospiraceae bacterium]
MKFKTELHCHSIDGSECASESAEGIVAKYTLHGYSTILLTNHFAAPKPLYDRELILSMFDHQYKAYEKLCSAAAGKLNILMGLEFKFRENGNDYLVFGFTREYIESLDFEIFIGLKDFAEVVRKDGIFIAQAHPFRFGMTLMKPNLLDGIEVFNGHFYHNSHNFLAEAYADSHNMIKTSGTDHHDPEHTPNGGILTDVEIKTETQLIEILKSGKYELIKC